MALEQAGVSLQAEGYSKYIRQLETIDKTQQDVFDVDSREVTRAFNNASKAADKYEKELQQVAKANKDVGQSQSQFSQGLQAAAVGLTALATGAIAQYTAESAKLAAQFQGQRTGLNNLAAAAGQSGTAIQAAIQSAAKGTVSGLDAITAANQGLLFGVAQTPEQFAELTRISTILGRTLGLDATRSIEEFTLALGRGSKEILDNFGVSAKAVNAEIERIAQADFGKANSQLTEAQKQAVFLQAALKIAGEAATVIGEEAGAAQASFDRLTASSENLKVTFGALAQPLGVGISDALVKAARTAQQVFAFLGAGFTGVGSIATGVFGNIVNFFKGEATRSVSDILDEASILATERFKEIASTIEGVSFDEDKIVKPIEDLNDELEMATVNVQAYQSALEQAQNLQLSFARAAEDAAIKQSRAIEDVARREARQVSKLRESQAKDRDKLLRNQQKQLDRFEADRQKQISKAENDIREARKQAGEQRKRDQQKLQRELQEAQERFNLDQLQSERRFRLQEQRLIAEGDALALKELREDEALRRQEEKENFDLGKKEQITSAKEQQREQAKDLENRINELKTSLEERRAELLASFDEQLRDQAEAQAEQKAQLLRGLEEAAADREIALQREEEDRRLSQSRQLEDLGRSFAEQEGITAEGAAAVAAELEKVFGIDGTADNIITGFTSKTENEFSDLFKNLEKIVKDAETVLKPEPIPITTQMPPQVSGGSFGGRIGGVQEFQEGGVVQGPLGAPVPAIVHGGETVLPTHQRSFTMAAPIIPSQNLNVNMSGGFNIAGEGQADERILRAAAAEMTENFRIAVMRLARRN